MHLKKLCFILCTLVLLAACTKSEETPPQFFDACVDIEAAGETYTAIYEKRNGYDRLVFSKPSWLILTLSDDGCTAEIGEISFKSEAFKAAFDFLPTDGEGEKKIGIRTYKIYDLRGVG